MSDKIENKIIVGLERVSEAFKSLLWEKAKLHGLSPIQIQILLFIQTHRRELCSVSHLAQEFEVTKPTVSDAVRVLDKKGLVEKDYSGPDSRSYLLYPSTRGEKLFEDLNDFVSPMERAIKKLNGKKQTELYKTLADLIFQLNAQGVLEVQRICFGCKFYEKRKGRHYCHFLKENLKDEEIRIDCNEFEK